MVAAVAVPKESSYVHYQANSSGLLDKYKCGENFPLEFDVTDALPNDCQLVESDLPTNKELTEEEFLTLFEEYNPPTQQPSIWKRLMASVSSFG